MVDGGETANDKQSDCHFRRGGCETTGDRRNADTDKKDLHHAVAALFVGNPAGRNGTQSKRHHAGCRIRKQFCVTHVPIERELENGRYENQDE